MLKKELLLESLILATVFFIFSGGLQIVSGKAYSNYQEACK